MKLNIVTAGANSVGKTILEKVTNPNDITISLSRKGCGNITNVIDARITNLINKETTTNELLEILSVVDISKIKKVNLYHNCGYVVGEIPGLNKNNEIFTKYPDLLPKMFLQDEDGDGIDDRTYNSAITTFTNVFNTIHTISKEMPLSLGIICSLTDKKRYITTIFQSMVKTNRKLRELIEKLTMEHNHINGTCISASTVRTETEEYFRQYSCDKEYRADPKDIAEILIESMQSIHHTYVDIDVFVPHPEYEIRFKNETDKQFTERLKSECLGEFNF